MVASAGASSKKATRTRTVYEDASLAAGFGVDDAPLAVGAAGFGLTLIGPAAMYLFLMKLTGIPHVERESLAKRGDDYRQYQETTPILIPWPKKRIRTQGFSMRNEPSATEIDHV